MQMTKRPNKQTPTTQGTGQPIGHSAVRGYPDRRAAGHPAMGSSERLDRTHVDGTLENKVKGGVWHTQRWPNAFFAKRWHLSLKDAHARFGQSTGTY